MKRIIYLILIAVFSIATNGGHAQPFQHPHYWINDYIPPGMNLHPLSSDPWSEPWEMVFEENFDVNASYPDFSAYTANWDIKEGYDHFVPGGATPQIFTFRQKNVEMFNGKCFITAKKEFNTWSPQSGGTFTFDYTSGGIQTDNDLWNIGGIWEYGMFEARIRMSPAVYGHDNMWVWAPFQGEIDGCEMKRNKKKIPHHFHRQRYPPESIDPDDPADHCNDVNILDHKAWAKFHIYTIIWDKYYIYTFIDHQLTSRRWIPKFHDGDGSGFWHLDQNTGASSNDMYALEGCFMPINQAGRLIIDQAFDSKWAPDMWSPKSQNAGLPGTMIIDYVRVYQRNKCSQAQVITTPKLLPFMNLSEQSITLGTNALPTTVQNAWESVSTHLDKGTYEGTYIEMVDNFDFNAHNAPVTTAFEFKTKLCPDVKHKGYVWDTTFVDSIPLPEIDTSPCADIDTAEIDSLFSIGNPAIIAQVLAGLAEIGCDYQPQGNFEPGQGQYRRAAPEKMKLEGVINDIRIKIYPNPNNGYFNLSFNQELSVDVQISNVVGQLVHSEKIRGKEHVIRLDSKLPPGTYTIRIIGDGVKYIEKITLIR